MPRRVNIVSLGNVLVPAYLALRQSAHVIARHWYARGQVRDVWRQAASTKRWDTA